LGLTLGQGFCSTILFEKNLSLFWSSKLPFIQLLGQKQHNQVFMLLGQVFKHSNDSFWSSKLPFIQLLGQKWHNPASWPKAAQSGFHASGKHSNDSFGQKTALASYSAIAQSQRQRVFMKTLVFATLWTSTASVWKARPCVDGCRGCFP
jgi:hypothetical protein